MNRMDHLCHPVTILIDKERERSTSIFWFDHLPKTKVGSLLEVNRATNIVISLIRLLRLEHALPPDRVLMTMQNSRLTQMVLLLASVRAIKRPIVVLELNLKWSEGSLLEKYLARLIYRKVTLLTVLAPSDRNLLIREARINGEKVKVLDQWAQPDRFAEVCSPRIQSILSEIGSDYIISAGRSSRKIEDLFEALLWLPKLRAIIIGEAPECVPEPLRDRVKAIPALQLDEYIYLLRRAKACIIPLQQVDHTCGIRVWFQSVTVGTPVVITATKSVKYYASKALLAHLYEPGDTRTLSDHIARLMLSNEARADFIVQARNSLLSLFSPEKYDNDLASLLSKISFCHR
jgi:glycosyltransferase involved in cell wall biosynthesis